MLPKKSALAWHVVDAQLRSVALAAHGDGGHAGVWARIEFRSVEDQVPDIDDAGKAWTFRLAWSDRPGGNGVGPWVARGLLRPSDADWWIEALTVEKSESADAADGITGRVLREVPVGLVHDALFVVSYPQLVYALKLAGADYLWNDNEVASTMRIGMGGRYLDRGEELLLTIQELRPGLRLTRERPRIGGSVPETWPSAPGRPRGRPRRTTGELAAFAQAFLEVRGNYKALCVKRDMEYNTAKDWVRACRRAGLLAPGKSGRAESAIAGPELLGFTRRSER